MTGPVFDHAGVETTDFDADVAQYASVVGARVLRTGVHVVTGRRIAMLAVAGAKVELVEVEATTGRFAHTAYRVAEMPEGAVVVRIEAARADSCLLPMPGGSGIQLIRYDPDSPDLLPGE